MEGSVPTEDSVNLSEKRASTPLWQLTLLDVLYKQSEQGLMPVTLLESAYSLFRQKTYGI